MQFSNDAKVGSIPLLQLKSAQKKTAGVPAASRVL
jgi:hypothetical protein